MLCDFESDNKFTDYELLMNFNPKFINSKIKVMKKQIECMYHLSTTHVTDNGNMLVPISYSTENLAIYIIEEKNKLNYYKHKSEKRLRILKRVISKYTRDDQEKIMLYLSTNGLFKDNEIIDKLKVDLHNACKKQNIKKRCDTLNENEMKSNVCR